MSENECKVEPDCFLVITASSRIPADTDHALIGHLHLNYANTLIQQKSDNVYQSTEGIFLDAKNFPKYL